MNLNNSFMNSSEYDANKIFTFDNFDSASTMFAEFSNLKKTLTMSEEFLQNFSNVDYVCRVFSKVGTKSFNEKKSLFSLFLPNFLNIVPLLKRNIQF